MEAYEIQEQEEQLEEAIECEIEESKLKRSDLALLKLALNEITEQIKSKNPNIEKVKEILK